jgi:hypothetical protein
MAWRCCHSFLGLLGNELYIDTEKQDQDLNMRMKMYKLTTGHMTLPNVSRKPSSTN